MRHRIGSRPAAGSLPRLLRLLIVALLAASPGPTLARVVAHHGEITLPTYGWAANQHPHFRGTDGKNIYPYPMLDFLSRDKTNRTYRTVVLENEYLRITFLPELGGKIHEVLDKTTGQPMFYVNHVIKPGLIGQCGAWTSGGVEWNTGPQGHTVSCMQPVNVLILAAEKDGSRSVAIGETERIYGTRWTVVVTLRPGRAFIEERIRIYNPTATVRPYYFWNCTAVPNTPGFRFIYPMTLGCDHAGEKFFNWPMDQGKDLSRGTNYQDAASIFAWHCDQDFFGSYNDDLARGVVAYANHHQLPGKKAWTWGHGSFGTMHQMDLTDDDGPYNEVQTGPLLTQARVGRLDPGEAVEWKEWWYPIHDLGGFTFANQAVAVNASVGGGALNLRMLGTARWKKVKVQASNQRDPVVQAHCRLSPESPVELGLPVPDETGPWHIRLVVGEQTLAQFSLPLDLPQRQPPPARAQPATASELVQTAWEHYLFARFSEADANFRAALKLDPSSAAARTGLAFLKLDPDPSAAATEARAALVTAPDKGLAHLALAAAATRTGDLPTALEHAWAAALDPATAVGGRALVAKLLLRQNATDQAIAALSGSGPWEVDPVCRGWRAVALLQRAAASATSADQTEAVRLARLNLAIDPLDEIARAVLWLAGQEEKSIQLARLMENDPQFGLNLIAQLVEAGQEAAALRVSHALSRLPLRQSIPMVDYWSEYLAAQTGNPQSSQPLPSQPVVAATTAFPSRWQSEPALRFALKKNSDQGGAALLLGHLLFHLGRHAAGREMWQRAVALDTQPVLACRALGMAAKTLDNDLPAARTWLTQAHRADSGDSIVARDLANVLFALADKAGSDAEKRALATEARDCLQAAFPEGKGRSDFVALLGRAWNRLGEFAATARMLDTVRVTIWEGAHEVHDLFVESHLALGTAHLDAGRAAEALAEFNRALEYPANLATGKLENAREAHIHLARGNALAALGRKAEAAAAWKLAATEPESSDPKIEAARKEAGAALENLTQ